MATFLLIHGADREGDLWDKVVPILKNAGHKLFAPTMTPMADGTLHGHIDEICEVITTHNLKEIYLVGFSYGGMVATGVADKHAERIKHLVYLDSIVPISGKSLYENAQAVGLDFTDLGLPRPTEPPVLEPLHYDPKKQDSLTKSLIFCLQGEFRELMRYFYDQAKTSPDWHTFTIDTTHTCMLSMPQEVAATLHGLTCL